MSEGVVVLDGMHVCSWMHHALFLLFVYWFVGVDESHAVLVVCVLVCLLPVSCADAIQWAQHAIFNGVSVWTTCAHASRSCGPMAIFSQGHKQNECLNIMIIFCFTTIGSAIFPPIVAD